MQLFLYFKMHERKQKFLWAKTYLTLKHPGFFDRPWPGGGGSKTKRFSIYNIAIFPSKSVKHGLKWKLTSLPNCRVLDYFSRLHSFAVRWRRSNLLWPWKFSSFQYHNFWKFVIFDLHGQYVHQMKAENILNANLT